ncbi:hypothetical protein D9619_000063 [Psilocybe cf. subviscida]|uniref:Fork-head domain-containing protein n=1 Tax=Psilocybe cf. subviscida TaxID=2480587 RepID=A0A8H5BII3_9AGAR|nr:hypothetical protein D9619_000063 [Psilocybe cf. subviscida]
MRPSSYRKSSQYQPRTIQLVAHHYLGYSSIQSSGPDNRSVFGHTVELGMRSGRDSAGSGGRMQHDAPFADSVPEVLANGIAPDNPALPSQQETERRLREYLQISAPRPLDLSSMRDYEPPKKLPNLTHLILLAIWGSPSKRLTQAEICEAISTRYPELNSTKDQKWRGSIRHRLSLKAIFVHVKKPQSGRKRGDHWIIDVSKGMEGTKRGKSPHKDRGRQSGSGDVSRRDYSPDDDSAGDDEHRSSLRYSPGFYPPYLSHGNQPITYPGVYDPQEGQNPGGQQLSYHSSDLFRDREAYGTHTSASTSEFVAGYGSAYAPYPGLEYSRLCHQQIPSTGHSFNAKFEHADVKLEENAVRETETGYEY